VGGDQTFPEVSRERKKNEGREKKEEKAKVFVKARPQGGEA